MSRRTAVVPSEPSGGPVSRRSALGVVIDRRPAGPGRRPLLRGAHAAAATEVTHGLRVRAVRTVLPPDAVLGGRSALWAWGVEVAGPDDPVEVVLAPPRRVRQRPYLRVRGDVLLPGEVADSTLGPVTSPARTAFDIGRRGPPRLAVPLLDALARATGVTADDVEPLTRAHREARDVARLPWALAEMDGRAESPCESLLRGLVVGAGLPRPVVQHPVRDRYGRFVARVALAWPELRIALECDGTHRDDPARVVLDRQRLDALQGCGWSVVVVDRRQLLDEFRVVAMMRSLRLTARTGRH